MATLLPLLDTLRADQDLFGPDGACPTLVEEGTNPRILLVTGGNAGGKSLVCRYLGETTEPVDGKDVEFMRVGMGLRTETGPHRAFLFGEEDRESTGRISMNTVRGGMETCRNRQDPHILCLDEPDIGLSEEMQGGLGAALAQFCSAMPAATVGLIVVTHSRHIANAMLPLGPWCIRVGDDLRPTAEWTRSLPQLASAEEFMALAEVARNRMLAVKAVTDVRAAARR